MFIRTTRLLIRPMWREDAPALHAAMNDWDIIRHTGSVPWPFSADDAAERVLRPCEPDAADFGIFLHDGCSPAALVGGIGFGHWNDRVDHAELGYWLARAVWGQVLATEAGAAVLALAFEGLRMPCLGAGHYVDNPASGAVLRKLGFVATGEVLPFACRARGEDIMSVEYLLTATQWRAHARAARQAA